MNNEKEVDNLIKIIYGDITKLDCECIVNAANKSLLGGGGVDGAIHSAAGSQLLEECIKLNGCRTGEAKITKGYNLKAKYIIHTVGPVYRHSGKEEMLLTNCYNNCLNLAMENNIHEIAFPSISTGIFGYPLKKAVKIAVDTVKKWLLNNDYEIKVTFCCYNKETEDEYNNYSKNKC